MRKPPRRAPLGARALATAVDAAIGIAGFVALAYAGGAMANRRLWPPSWWQPADGQRAKRALDELAAVFDERNRAPLMRAALFVLEVQGERGETPGARRAGIVRVNARSRRRVGLAEAVARAGLSHSGAWISRRLTRKPRLRAQDHTRRTRELAPLVDAIRREHGADEQTAGRAITTLYEEHGIDSAGCLAGWLRMVATGQVVGFLTRRLRRRVFGQSFTRLRG